MLNTIIFFTGIILLSTVNVNAQDNKPEFQMRYYYFVILRTGPYTSSDTTEINNAFSGHMANIHKMRDAGKLMLSGPFAKGSGDYRGIFIIDAETESEVNELLSHDPAISTGFLKPEIIRWYGPAVININESYK